METELRSNLMLCAASYAEARKVSLSTLGRLAAGDWRFFREDGGKTFTARKYDEVMIWFSEQWPEGLDWPTNVPRPAFDEARA
jgi:hypothetical protein